jgi:hypothetical protein
MTTLFLHLLIVAYAVTGLISIVGYLPTIKDLWHHKKMSANISSYIIWTACGGITFLYSLFVLPDLLFQIVSGLGFFSCAIILVLAIWLANHKDIL